MWWCFDLLDESDVSMRSFAHVSFVPARVVKTMKSALSLA
jgi:hypothetical protein